MTSTRSSEAKISADKNQYKKNLDYPQTFRENILWIIKMCNFLESVYPVKSGVKLKKHFKK